MHEWPLIIFTVLSQFAIGTFITMHFYDLRRKNVSQKTGNFIMITVLVVGAIGVMASLFHLGHPFNAINALRHFFVSWLSREVVFYSLFIALVAVYGYLWYKNSNTRVMIGHLTSLIGLVTVFSTAMIYTLPSVPAWNNFWPLISFFLTTAILGPVFVNAVLAWRGEKEINLRSVYVYIAIITAGALVITIGYITLLYGGVPEAIAAADFLMANSIFWIGLILSFAALVLTGIALYKGKMVINNKVFITVLFAIVLLSEFFGRFMFYESGIHL